MSSHNHVSYAGGGVKHVTHLAIVQMLFLCKRLIMKKTNGATIYVLVIVSYHIIAGAQPYDSTDRENPLALKPFMVVK